MSSRANCCVPGCNSMYKNNPELAFRHFPKIGEKVGNADEFGIVRNVDRRELWQGKLKIGKSVTPNMRVCAKHFSEKDYTTPHDWGYLKKYLKKTAVPSKHLPKSSITKPVSYEQEEAKNKREARLLKRRTAKSDTPPKTSREELTPAETMLDLSQNEPPKSSEVVEDMLPIKTFADAATQTENDSKEMLHAAVQVNTSSWSSITDFIQTDRTLNILTGLPSLALLTFLTQLLVGNEHQTRRQRLGVKDRIVLVFLKLKLDLTYSALDVFFGNLSVSTSTRIFEDTIEVLSNILANFIYLPSKEEVSANIPSCFEKHQKVRIVLDCTEVKVQVPKKLCCRIKLYSNYKKAHTLKFITAVTPAGLIAYASPSYGGRASDKSIFEQSGLIQQLTPYLDEIMVDKAFLIDGLCEEFNIKLVRPAFLRRKKQFTKSEASRNKTIASARVHIERVNARIKVFRIFRNTFPLHLVPTVDDIFITICAIVNLSSPILRDDLFLQK